MDVAQQSRGEPLAPDTHQRGERSSTDPGRCSAGDPDRGRLRVEQVVGQGVPLRKLMLQLTPRVFVGAPLGAQPVVDFGKLGGPFVDDLLLAARRQTERRHLVANQRAEVRHSRARRLA